MTEAQSLKRTPLYDCHLEAGAKMVDFAGWEMPVQYSGVIEEHRAVRTAAGLFDVSHMELDDTPAGIKPCCLALSADAAMSARIRPAARPALVDGTGGLV